MRRGIYGPALTYTCRPRKDGAALETLLTEALDRLPAGIVTASAESPADADADDEAETGRARRHRGRRRHDQGRLLPHRQAGRLMQIVDGEARAVAIKEGKGSSGILARDAKIIRALLPIRDAVREVLRAQAADQPWARGANSAAHRLQQLSCAASGRSTTPSSRSRPTRRPARSGRRHRRPNLAPFADDPDCWLVASIEDYDLESGLARMGPIFRERVIAPPAAPLIATAADALAVTLNETGRVDIDHLAELLDRDPETALAQLGDAVFRNPGDRSLGDRRRLSLGLRPHQARDRRGGGRARSAVCAQRRRAAARAARGPAAVGHHRASRRAVDSRRRHRGLRRRGDGHRDPRAPHRRDRLLVRGHRAVRRHRRRHLGMGHRRAATPAGCCTTR